MNKKVFVYGGFFVVLVLIFWVALGKYTDMFNQSSLSKRNQVQEFAFQKEDGSLFTNAMTDGKVCVVQYFFTTCKGICPRMNNNMRRIYEAFKNEPNFLILSHTCDPEIDTVAQMKRYADSMNVDLNKWIFLTGRKDSLYKMARFSYGIDDPKNVVANIKDDFLHSQFIALVDKNGIVRGGVYDGLKTDELERLKKDITSLLKEKKTEHQFSGGMFGNNPN
jgi:protein SCO1/2